MKKIIHPIVFSLVLTVTSCAELLQVANQVNTSVNSPQSISNAENISGLKNALNVGIDQAVKNLGVENGFYKNEALKILLPKEAQPIIDNIKLIPGGQKLIDNAVLALNRSAEDAVKEATPIFVLAIKNMSIGDAKEILFGNENATTEYLRRNTYSQLQSAFAPKIKTSLEKPLLAGISTNETWNKLSSAYNSVANSGVGLVTGLKPVDIQLEDYVTQKALDALFVKIADEERNIRQNPLARVNEILKKVFGQLDKKQKITIPYKKQ